MRPHRRLAELELRCKLRITTSAATPISAVGAAGSSAETARRRGCASRRPAHSRLIVATTADRRIGSRAYTHTSRG